MRTLPVAVDAESDSGVLRAKPELGVLGGRRVVERDTPKVRADTRTGVFVAPYSREIHKADRDNTGATDPNVCRNGIVVGSRVAGIAGRCSRISLSGQRRR